MYRKRLRIKNIISFAECFSKPVSSFKNTDALLFVDSYQRLQYKTQDKKIIKIQIPVVALYNNLKVYQIDLYHQSALPVQKN